MGILISTPIAIPIPIPTPGFSDIRAIFGTVLHAALRHPRA